MKKLISYIIFTVLISMSAHAQNTAENILDKASAKVKSAKGITLSFSLTQKDKLKRVVSATNGVIKIKNTKFYIKQGENEIFNNGTQTWTYNGEDEVIVSKTAQEDDELSPQQIITGFSKKDFTTKLISSAGTNNQVQLIPTDKRKNYSQVTLYINKTSSLITKAVITDKSGADTEISFKNVVMNASVPDSQFIFDASKHPGVEVVNQ